MFKLFFNLLLIILISSGVSAQNLIESLTSIKQSITIVESENTTIEPEFTFETNTYGKVNLSISATSRKGNTSMHKYSWNMADIDPNTVVYFVKGKQIAVNIAVKNKERFIKREKDGRVSYVSELSIPVSNADDIQVLLNEIKSAVAYSNLGKLKSDSFASSMNWMAKNVGKQHSFGKIYAQSWKYLPDENNKIVFTQSVTGGKEEASENIYEFYMNDFFENTVKLNISGDHLEVELKTIGSKKLIKHLKNGARSTYVSGIEIISNDVDQARNMIDAIQTAISEFEVKNSKYNSVSSALSFVDSQIVNIPGNKETIVQSMKSTASGLYKVIYNKQTTNAKGDVKEETYTFFWSHIEANLLSVDIAGSRLYVELKTKENRKFISHVVDGKTMPLLNDLKIEISDLANAKDIINALQYSIPLSEPTLPDFTSRLQAVNWLKENINLITINDKKYEQLFEIVNSKSILNVNYSDAKSKSKNSVYEFYIFTLAKDMLKIEVKGEDIYLNLETADKNKYIRYIEDGLLKSYNSEVNILCKDAIEAQIMKSAFNYIIENTPDFKEFGSVMQAKAFLMNNIVKVENPGITYNQSIRDKDGDNCVVLFNYSKISAKAKAELRFYELDLGYLSPDQIKLNAKGKDLFIEVFTRGKQKLIKSYENNKLKNYTTSISIQMNDVLAGLRMETALKMLAEECEK